MIAALPTFDTRDFIFALNRGWIQFLTEIEDEDANARMDVKTIYELRGHVQPFLDRMVDATLIARALRVWTDVHTPVDLDRALKNTYDGQNASDMAQFV